MNMGRRGASRNRSPERDVGHMQLFQKITKPYAFLRIRIQRHIDAAAMIKTKFLVDKRLSQRANRKRLMKLN